MITILGFPVIALLVIIQSSIISRLNISFGQADLVILAIIAWALNEKKNAIYWWALFAGILQCIISAVPFYLYVFGYLTITVGAVFIRKKLWNVPVITMILMSFIGTIVILGLSFMVISLTVTPLPLRESIINIIIPSAAMNMVLGIPVFIVMKDLASMVYPVRE
jgi:rod shape-determining protein MreD